MQNLPSRLYFIKFSLFLLICFTITYLVKIFDMVKFKNGLTMTSIYNQEKLKYLILNKKLLELCNYTIKSDLDSLTKSSYGSVTKVNIIPMRINDSNKTNKTATKTTYIKIGNKNPYQIELDKTEYEFDEIETKFDKNNYLLKFGGKWSPTRTKCEPVNHVAIIIPYRDRLGSLKLFLSNMHPFFINQYLSYTVYLIEPIEKLTFNRGLLMNIGFLEALKESNNKIDCFFFHDVDMYAEDRRNIYECDPNLPSHYATAVSKFDYSTTGYFDYGGYFGGINSFTKEQFEKINGFSNAYYGWGAEDDDLMCRVNKIFSKYNRKNTTINRYFMPSHSSQKVNDKRFEILKNSNKRYANSKTIDEGLSTLKYKVKRIEKTLLFTRLFVDYPLSL